jgi:hypothetical protein
MGPLSPGLPDHSSSEPQQALDLESILADYLEARYNHLQRAVVMSCHVLRRDVHMLITAPPRAVKVVFLVPRELRPHV